MHPNLIQKIHPPHNLFRKPALAKQVMWGIKTAPKNPGVYVFYHNQIPLYIGKASNLKNRLQNYLKITDLKTKVLHHEANKLKLVKLHSNIEALIVESRLIKILKPKLNILWKDDKNYFYVTITKERFPKIFLTHQPEKTLSPNPSTLNPEHIGPFTDGQSIKAILRLLRKFFPYCSCFQPHFRLCLNAQIGNCPGYCCQITEKNNEKLRIKNEKKYQQNIRKIKNILIGKNKKFIRQLKDPYELLVLEKIWQHQPYFEKGKGLRVKGLENLKKILHPNPHALNPQRIECYDNSHLSGKEAVGAMTSWRLYRPQTTLTLADHADDYFPRSPRLVREVSEWLPEKPLWRKFKIRGNYTEDDPRMMEEVVSRRLNHPEWPYPELIIIDGGIAQLNAALRALKKLSPKPSTLNPKVISFAKPQKLVYGWQKYPVSLNQLPPEFQKIILLAIDRTHHFVQRYHRQIRKKEFLKM
jgi:excinuclease UvrABC nuclease subunit